VLQGHCQLMPIQHDTPVIPFQKAKQISAAQEAQKAPEGQRVMLVLL